MAESESAHMGYHGGFGISISRGRVPMSADVRVHRTLGRFFLLIVRILWKVNP